MQQRTLSKAYMTECSARVLSTRQRMTEGMQCDKIGYSLSGRDSLATVQTSQLSRSHRETHDFSPTLTVSR